MTLGRCSKMGFVMLCVLGLITSGCRGKDSSLLVPDSNEAKSVQVLTIGTADSGGTMYPAGRAIAEILNAYVPELKINTSASNGSLTNVQALQDGQIDLGLVSGDVAYCAYEGTQAFEQTPVLGLRAIGAMYLSYSNWIAKDSLDAVYVHDLLGKRVAVGPEDSTTEISARIVLKSLGINAQNTILENYGLGSGVDALKDGTLDAVHGLAGIPINGMEELCQKSPCRLLLYTDDELDDIVANNRQYISAVIPAGTYLGQTQDVRTFGVKCLLCVSENMDEDLVYTITRVLMEATNDLAERHTAMTAMGNPDFVYSDLPIPIHPGALRYYHEAGWL